MATLRYRTSDNWEKLHVVEVPTELKALELAYELTVENFKKSMGDISIDGKSYPASKIPDILEEYIKKHKTYIFKNQWY